MPKRRIAVLNGQPDFCDDVLALEGVLRDTDLRKVVILCWHAAGAKAEVEVPGTVAQDRGVRQADARAASGTHDRQVRVLHPLVRHCTAFRSRWSRSTCGTACR